MLPSRPWLPYAAVGLSVVLWSTAYVLSALVLDTASPAVLSELRLLLALPLMVALVALRGRPGMAALAASLRDRRAVILGLTGVALYYLPSNLGLASTGAGTAALMSASLPVLTAALAWLVLRERMNAGMTTGLVLATAGVALASVGAQVGVGAGLLVAGLVAYAAYTVLLRRWALPEAPARPLPEPVVLSTATVVWGVVMLLPWLGAEQVAGTIAWPSDAVGWLGILLLAFVVTVPTMVLFNYGAERVPAVVSGTATAGVPVLGYGFALLLGETPQPLKVLGGVIALVGIAVSVIAARPRAHAAGAAAERPPVSATATVEMFADPERAGAVSSTATAGSFTGEVPLPFRPSSTAGPSSPATRGAASVPPVADVVTPASG
ncbi:DMT family transporter [Microbacterium sp. CJ88]|uniref:DMT family transporter n=1 Tax=Microbacterium sp. CJ88 TaxID=3445672 RepID=UPI003F655B65